MATSRPAQRFSKDLPPATRALLDRRARLLGPNVPTFYDEPVHLVRGEGVWLWDAEGRRYLDCYNNVPHVGHCHPKVVDAIARQAATLNTHTRYLHEAILEYADALTATFSAPLDSAILTCTGSEANDIALRIAQAATGKTGVIATDHTYHGNTLAVSQLSRTMPPPGGYWDNVLFVTAPDSYRSPEGAPGEAFARELGQRIKNLDDAGHGFSALIICPYFANEGFPDLEPAWYRPVIDAVRKAGGLIIADEVQCGFGRLGSHMWGHERAGFTPDIVTLGKPMANGHPVGGVVTSADFLAAFRETFRYFNTFGGNPVSSAAAMATLDVLREEGLMKNAALVGSHARAGLEELASRHEAIGDVRGSGLFFGAELVRDRATKAPATAHAKWIANEMRRRGILINFLGIHYNTLKCRPPLPFSMENADQLLATLDELLAQMPVDV
ncbi:MAG: aminotransferase class III-fold pyridoxal phosphate-dependent enzyme [Pseudomonadota bacterium]